MSVQVSEKYFTKFVIDATKLNVYEADSEYIELEVQQGDENSPNGVRVKSAVIGLVKKDDFTYRGVGEVIIEDVIVGHYYWFRTRVVKADGEESNWSAWESERAGDTTNEIVFSNPTVVNTSSASTFRVGVNTIPEDFEKFVWKIQTAAANIEDNPEVPPSEPTAPDANATPDVETMSVDDISISVNESRVKWFHVWVRALDKSGNRAPGTNNGWYYVGCGKLKAIDLRADADPYPPDNTAGHIIYDY